MEKAFRYTCACCGEEHEGAPGFAYDTPNYYREDRPNSELTSDFYTVDDEFFFIRTILDVPILEYDEPFSWGVWVSLSRDNFLRYRDIYDEPIQEGEYFGWFNNRLPYYPDTINIKTSVHLRSGGIRPWIEPEPTDHPLSRDYHNGISWEKAIEIAQIAMHGYDA